jgi:hypothetical protein
VHAGRIQFLNLPPYKPFAPALSDVRDGPYTLARAADLAIPRQGSGYPHIASLAAMFQFCSDDRRGVTRAVDSRPEARPGIVETEPQGVAHGTQIDSEISPWGTK